MKRGWKYQINKASYTLAALTIAFAHPTQAAIRSSDHRILFSREIDLSANQDAGEYSNDISKVQPITSLREFTQRDMAELVPTSMTSTTSSGRVAAQILDHSLNTYFKNSRKKNSDFGSAAYKMERMLEKDIAFGGSQKDATKHIFKMRMKAAQTKAELGYEGLLDARLSYQLNQQKMNFELAQKLDEETNLVLSHTVAHSDRTDMLSLRWNF